jgi:trk system potassium uptake protein TrkH
VIWPHLLLLGLAATGVAMEYGFREPPLVEWINRLAQVVLVSLYVLDTWLGARRGRVTLPGQRVTLPEMVIQGLAGLAVVLTVCSLSAWWLFETALLSLLVGELWRLNVALSRRLSRPSLLLPLSFVALILVGTAMLKLPLATPPGQPISWLDALFTITSAVCVTGLTVRDTATMFTPLGQTIIGVFIQMGGLGIMIFGSMLAALLGSRLSLREDINLSQSLNDVPISRTRQLAQFVVFSTLMIELIGAVALYGMWQEPLTTAQRVGFSLFHSVSAYCNAGFALYSNSLEGYRYSVAAHGVILPLLVIGGLGFPVLDNLWSVLKWKLVGRWRQPKVVDHARPGSLADRRLNLHSKIVLSTTAGLYLFGAGMIFLGQLGPYIGRWLELGVTANMQELPPLSPSRLSGMLADASFMSAVARTAGFNTVPMAELTDTSSFSLVMLMLTGGSPGGTAGGMKTTTLALLLLAVLASMRQRERVEAFGRTISDTILRKAGTLVTCYVGVLCTSTLLLSLTEPFPFMKLLFEATSALSVTGLSLGITPNLSPFGKLTLIATMFIGRVGPLALIGAITFGGRRRPYAYPHEQVYMG